MEKEFDIEITTEEKNNESGNVQLPLNFLSFGEIEPDDVKVYIKQDVYKALEKYANVYAAYIDKNCFGILVMYANNMETKEGYISLVGIKKEFEQKGMGTYLIKMAERYAMEAGMEKLKLEVDNNNVHAQRFYKRNNFVFGATTDRNSMYMIKDLPIKKSTYSS